MDFPNTQTPDKQQNLKPQLLKLTIQRILEYDNDTEYPYHRQKQKNKCIKCGIKENQIRYCNRIIIITFQQTNQSYCDECLQLLLLQQQKEVKKLEQRYIYQKQFQASINQNDVKFLGSVQDDIEAIGLQAEVQELQQAQNQIDYQLGKAKTQCTILQQKVLILQQKQEKFWSDMNKFQKRALKLQEKSFIAKNQGQIEKKSLQNLSRTSVIHIFFKIHIQDNYAMIYNLIIGKKPQQLEVNWEETNTGIGHLLLAYNYLILKYNLTYTRIQDIKIKGHLSQILLRNSDTYYPIGYGITTGSITCSDKIFGILMQCLLSQMADLAQHIQQIQNIEYSQQLKLPFMIQKKQGKILDLYVNPIKLQEKTKWSQWTKAMRYFLINFKHILTIAALSDPYL